MLSICSYKVESKILSPRYRRDQICPEITKTQWEVSEGMDIQGLVGGILAEYPEGMQWGIPFEIFIWMIMTEGRGRKMKKNTEVGKHWPKADEWLLKQMAREVSIVFY